MTNHAALTLVGAVAAQPLTPTGIAFYATAATIIPVLFLAIAVQGRVLETLVNAATNAAHDYQRARRSRARLKAIAAQTRSIAPVSIAIVVVHTEPSAKSPPSSPSKPKGVARKPSSLPRQSPSPS